MTARQLFTATLLPDGKVLATGGQDNFNVVTAQSAELFDPATGTWTATGSLNTRRFSHAATLLSDGKVLVAGGDSLFTPTTTAELFDPSTGIWTTTGSLHDARRTHTQTLLPDGKVLAAAGFYDDFGYGGFPIKTAELYDPTSGTWATTGSLAKFREGHTATLLANGQVLVAGGADFSSNGGGFLASTELYDPTSGTWAAGADLTTERSGHTGTLLPNGQVLVAGGYTTTNGYLASAELYDPASDTWTATGDLNTARENHTATLLSDGKVLVAGGINSNGSPVSAELYDPSTGLWTTTASLATGRFAHTATLLPDGSVLIAGGNSVFGAANTLDSAELYVQLAPLLNISTRLDVETGDNVMIGGFIVTGSEPETVIVRGIGPSLPLPGALADPTLELYDSSGALLASNDNWKDDPNQQQVIDAQLAPTNEAEAALWQVLDPGAYTVILKGKNEGTGVGLIEVYEVGQGSDVQLANISTRGLVQTEDNVMIGGLIIGQGTGNNSARVLVRALGPSLPVASPLSDPVLELHDESGTLIDSNDNWKTGADGNSQQAVIEATGLQPNDDSESALLEVLPPGNYTAVVQGKDGVVGVGIVEFYRLP